MAASNSAPYSDRGYILITTMATTLALALALLSARLYVRIKITRNLGFDDFFIVLAMARGICTPVKLGLANEIQDDTLDRNRHGECSNLLWPRAAHVLFASGSCHGSGEMELCPITPSRTCCYVYQDIYLHLPTSSFPDNANEVDVELGPPFYQWCQHYGQFSICYHGTTPMYSYKEALGS